ncbi:VOC family protein [Peptostreptococcus anaerobius]|uniref:VOC family protein n=1 Tax=Peptostreptococcus porci TaxID=2652282 RepID=A0A6N7WYA2_9FIRM|nr:VOC family protein [Peptostreptococcus porci]MDY6232007.1 VOC family protein [Peptostreptococcus porci]MST61845.1 VOC family protein [Peptostreptococcus porci]
MIKEISPYIVLNGNGRDAVEYYKDVLDAEVRALTFWKDFVPNCPLELEQRVINAQLYINGMRIQISDNSPEFEYKYGENVTIALISDDVDTSKKYFNNLKKDAKEVVMDLQETPWSPAYGNIVDKFGVIWQINTEV